MQLVAVSHILLVLAFPHVAAAQGKVTHVLELENSKVASLESALEVMAKHGVTADVARPLLSKVSEVGKAIVAQGSEDGLGRLKASFDQIDMQSTVRPITAEDRKGPPSEYKGSDVKELSVKELEEQLESDEGCLLVFHGTTCAHCKAMAPEYKEAATALKGSHNVAAVNLNDLDREVAQGLADKLGIVALPTVRFVRGGNHLEYNGPRTAAGFLQFVKSAATKKSADEASDVATESRPKADTVDAAAGAAETKEAEAEATPKPASKIGMSKVQPAAAAAA